MKKVNKIDKNIKAIETVTILTDLQSCDELDWMYSTPGITSYTTNRFAMVMYECLGVVRLGRGLDLSNQ